MENKDDKKLSKVYLKKTTTWEVCDASESFRSRSSVMCSLDVAHYHNYRKKQQEKLKALEENLLKTQNELNDFKNKYSAKEKQREKNKSKNKNILKNSIEKVELIRPDLYITTCQSISKNYANHLQTADTPGASAKNNNNNCNQCDRNNTVSFTICTDLNQQNKEIRSILTDTGNKNAIEKEEKPNKETNIISITTKELITDKGILLSKDNAQQKKTKNNVREKSNKDIKSTSTNTEKEIRNKEENGKSQTLQEIRKNDNPTLSAPGTMTQHSCIDMEPTPESNQEISANNATQTNSQLEHITSNMFIEDMFRSTPNEDVRICLEEFSSWTEFASHTATGRHCRQWFESSATRPQTFITSSEGRKRKNTSNEEFIDFETYHALKEVRTGPATPQEVFPTTSSVTVAPPLVRCPVPMPPPPRRCFRSSTVWRHQNYPAPVFPTPRGIPVTSTSTSATMTNVHPRFHAGIENRRSTSIHRSTPYPAQRARVTRSTGTLPRYAPTTDTDLRSMQCYQNQFNM